MAKAVRTPRQVVQSENLSTREEILATFKEEHQDVMVQEVPMALSVRKTRNDTFQIEIAEKRSLSTSSNNDEIQLVAFFNKSDSRFSSETTFRGWVTITSVEDLVDALKDTEFSEEDLATLLAFDEGTDDRIALFEPFDTPKEFKGKFYFIHLRVTEFLEDDFAEATLSEKQKNNIEDNIDSHILQTADGDAIVCGATGSRIIRIIDPVAVLEGASVKDRLISGKMLESDYSKKPGKTINKDSKAGKGLMDGLLEGEE